MSESGKRKSRQRSVRAIAAPRRSSGISSEGTKRMGSAVDSGTRKTVPDGERIETAEPSKATEPIAITLNPERRLVTTPFTGRELLSQLEMTLSASDSEIFLFGTLAYDLGIPAAVKILAGSRLQPEITPEQIKAPWQDSVTSHEGITTRKGPTKLCPHENRTSPVNPLVEKPVQFLVSIKIHPFRHVLLDNALENLRSRRRG